MSELEELKQKIEFLKNNTVDVNTFAKVQKEYSELEQDYQRLQVNNSDNLDTIRVLEIEREDFRVNSEITIEKNLELEKILKTYQNTKCIVCDKQISLSSMWFSHRSDGNICNNCMQWSKDK